MGVALDISDSVTKLVKQADTYAMEASSVDGVDVLAVEAAVTIDTALWVSWNQRAIVMCEAQKIYTRITTVCRLSHASTEFVPHRNHAWTLACYTAFRM